MDLKLWMKFRHMISICPRLSGTIHNFWDLLNNVHGLTWICEIIKLPTSSWKNISYLKKKKSVTWIYIYIVNLWMRKVIKWFVCWSYALLEPMWHIMGIVVTQITSNCLLNILFRLISNKTWKLHITGPLWEESVTSGSPHKDPVIQKVFRCYYIITGLSHHIADNTDRYSQIIKALPGVIPHSENNKHLRPNTDYRPTKYDWPCKRQEMVSTTIKSLI